jgi:uncharacterized protein (TIGR00369 family)
MRDMIIEAYKRTNLFGNSLGMDLKSASKDGVHYQMVIDKKHMATPLNAHGGAIASLMDGTLGVAALAYALENNNVVSTIEFKVNFIAPVYKGDVLDARGTTVHSGKRIMVCEGTIHNQKGEIVAKGTGTFNAYPVEKAGLF